MDMKADKKKIILNVYDEQIEVNVIKGEEDQYYDAARFVTKRILTYYKLHSGWKTTHTILLMTMLDIAINLTSTNEYKKGHRSIWRKIIEYLKS
jgi:cell division protein ZapA